MEKRPNFYKNKIFNYPGANETCNELCVKKNRQHFWEEIEKCNEQCEIPLAVCWHNAIEYATQKSIKKQNSRCGEIKKSS